MATPVTVPRRWVEVARGLPEVCLVTGAREGVAYLPARMSTAPWWTNFINFLPLILFIFWDELRPNGARYWIGAVTLFGYAFLGGVYPLLAAKLPVSDAGNARVKREGAIRRVLVGGAMAAILLLALRARLPRRDALALAIGAVVVLNALAWFLFVRHRGVRVLFANRDTVTLSIPSAEAARAIEERQRGLPPPPEGARCAVHGDAPAVLTCSRCGSFACEACRDPVVYLLCAACVNG